MSNIIAGAILLDNVLDFEKDETGFNLEKMPYIINRTDPDY